MSAKLKKVQKYYSNAQSIKAVVDEVLTAAKDRFGLSPSQIAYADSFCSDELNSMQFPENEMTGPFKLGGLGGYPFAGITGMNAFAAHNPDGGAAVIFYGPHIGITQEGQVGNIMRAGQNDATSCCGSVSAALANLRDDNIQKNEAGKEDYQQKVIEQILLKEKERIQNSNQQMVEAIEVLYEAIDRQVTELISQTNFPCKNTIKAGGIFINSDKDTHAYWAPRRFEIFAPTDSAD